jgi:hypothetical protein
MAEPDPFTSDSNEAAKSARPEGEVGWPLAYTLRPAHTLQPTEQAPLQKLGFSTVRAAAAKKPWWSHNLYRGPGNKPVAILYSKTKDQSEALAQLFVSESVVGFDMVILVATDVVQLLTLHLKLSGVALE